MVPGWVIGRVSLEGTAGASQNPPEQGKVEVPGTAMEGLKIGNEHGKDRSWVFLSFMALDTPVTHSYCSIW